MGSKAIPAGQKICSKKNAIALKMGKEECCVYHCKVLQEIMVVTRTEFCEKCVDVFRKNRTARMLSLK